MLERSNKYSHHHKYCPPSWLSQPISIVLTTDWYVTCPTLLHSTPPSSPENIFRPPLGTTYLGITGPFILLSLAVSAL